MNTPFLSGERVYLRPFENHDLTHMRKWVNDPEIRGIIGEVTSTNVMEAEKYFEKISNDNTREWFTVVLKEDDRVIGEGGLLRMFYPWRTTDMSLIIGEKEEWHKGYGSEAICLLLDYAFGYLNFHRVAIGVVAFNEKAVKFWEKTGFKREGIQREGYYYNHKYYDFIMMSLLEDEYRSLYKNGV